MADGWGFGPWGLSPWGFGVSAPALASAVAIRENAVRLTFTEPIVYDRTGRPRDGARASFYGVSPVAGTSGLDGEPARAVIVGRVDAAGGGGTVFDLLLDRALTHWPARYVANAHGVWGLSGLPIDTSGITAAFDGVRAGKVPLSAEDQPSVVGADIALPQTANAALAARADGALLGAFAVDATGDYAFDAGLQSLVKRIMRRLFATPGGFAHLPSYGLGLGQRVKRLSTAAERNALTRDAEAQVRQEPEVAEVKVEIAAIGGAAFRLKVRVRTRFGAEAEFAVPLPA